MATVPRKPAVFQPDSGPPPGASVIPPWEMALRLGDAGFSVIPVRADGSKVVDLKNWQRYQQHRATAAQLRAWFPEGQWSRGPAVLGGEVSGFAFVVDFDREDRLLFDAWQDLVEEERPGVVAQLAHVKSPCGYHAWGRCPDARLPGRLLLAHGEEVPGRGALMVEYRAHGHYTLVPGCPAACHRTGRLYLPLAGKDLCAVEPISPADLEALLRCAASLGTRPDREWPRLESADVWRPGDHYDLAGPDWGEILGPHGWVCVRTAGAVRYWRRPGKDAPGWSATTDHCRGRNGEGLLRVFSDNAAPFREGWSGGKFRAYAALNHGGSLAAAAGQLRRDGFGGRPPAPPAGGAVVHVTDVTGKGGDMAESIRGPGDRLIGQALARGVRLFVNISGTPHIQVPEGSQAEGTDRYTVYPADSEEFRGWLRELYRSTEGGRALPKQTLELAVQDLASRARLGGVRRRVCVRVDPREGDTVWIDVGDPAGEVISIQPGEWSRSWPREPLFVRPPGMRELPTALPEGDVDALAGWLNVADEGDWLLVLSWMVHALLGRPPFPVLLLCGPPGSAKSTTARMVRDLIDPHFSPLCSLPGNEHDLFIMAQQEYVLCFDNVGSMKPDMADALCRLSTGGGFRTRALFTDSDMAMLDAARPVIITSIADVATQADLVQRSLLIETPAIGNDRRRTEAELWDSWDGWARAFVGNLYDVAAEALAVRQTLRLAGAPRMAEFYRTGCAVSQAVKGSVIPFHEAYSRNRSAGAGVVLDAGVLTGPLEKLLEREPHWWEGSAQTLLDALALHATPQALAGGSWPRAANKLTALLRMQADALAEAGIRVEFDRTKATRIVRLSRSPFPAEG